MVIPHHKFDQITIAKIRNPNELKQLLNDPWLESETIVIKPNWTSTAQATFIDSKTLRMLLEVIDSRIVVTESYTNLFSHTAPNNEKMSVFIGDTEVTLDWFLKGDGWNWLIENPDWDWFKKKGYWDQLKKREKNLLDEYGFTDLFKEFDVSYINVTDEIWSGRIADPIKVKKVVESRFSPLQIDNLYSMVPKRFYDLRGSTFISFAKLKLYATFTVKNIFGMIPDPLRAWWHGKEDSRIVTSIIDINKIYHSLFNVYGICEALNATSFRNLEGKFEDWFLGKYDIRKNMGVISFGRHLGSLDSLLLNLTDHWIEKFSEWTQKLTDLAQKEFGEFDKKIL
ncbi:MAG: DUF362 domain-containing protein, partial [Promethearchaeota archaeon]